MASEENQQSIGIAPRVSVWATIVGCVVVYAVVAFSMMAMDKLRPQAKKSEYERPLPSVEVYTVVAEESPHALVGRGLLESRRVVSIAAEVAGRVVEISPNWKKGGIVREGELIARIDEADFIAMRDKMAAAVAQAQEVLIVEETQAVMSLAEWQRVSQEPPSALTKHEPQLRRARAMLASASADLAKAERDLQRTKILAPFSGRVRSTGVEVGSVASMGVVLGEMYSDQEIEVRVPIRIKEMADVDQSRLAEIELDHDSSLQKWQAKIIGFDGEIDRQTHTVSAILHLRQEENQPLPVVGAFVRAMLPLRSDRSVFPIPRQALQDGSFVHLINDRDEVERKKVTFVRGNSDTAFVEGLQVGQRIAITRLQTVLPFMKVRVVPSL